MNITQFKGKGFLQILRSIQVRRWLAFKWGFILRSEGFQRNLIYSSFSMFRVLLIFVLMQTQLKNELRNIISGKVQVRFGTIIQTIASDLEKGPQASSKIEDTKQIREQETERLEKLIFEKGALE